LQTKIEYKAKEVGIEVRYINPKYTSQRCSKCGCISANNRPSQAVFKCVKCGFESNADYNASQNIGISEIEKIIEHDLKLQCESADSI
jgi:transposase